MKIVPETIVKPVMQHELVYEWRKWLGIFSYRVEISNKERGVSVFIETPHKIKHVFINGEEVY